MSDDLELLHRFAADRSEAAFGELISRHLPLVYSAALRQTNGDAALAQDVAQLVFADLARKAPALAKNVVLAGWLHRATVFAARQILRGERRRRAREQEVVMMNAIQSETESTDWQQIRPLLDEALNHLKPIDRDALLLRFFESQSLAQVGVHLGSNEDAARKRVDRALEKLRTILIKRGVTTSTAALSTVITANAMQVAPASLAATLTNASLTAAGTGTTFAFLKIMTATQLKLGFSALVLAGATTAIVLQHQAQIQLHERNEALTQQISQLQTANDSLSNRLATAGNTEPLPDERYRELLKLRGEVGVLRQQIAGMGKLQNENQQLRNEVQAAQSKKQLPTLAQSEWHTTNTLNAARLIVLGMIISAGDNNDQFPTNFNQISTYTADMTNQTGGIGTEAFEMCNAVLANNQNPSQTIIIREQTPVLTPQGKWARTYGFADGHSVVEISDDGNFDRYEHSHMMSPINGQ